MLKGDFARKLNSEVDKDNIDSFRSFKKNLNRTTDERGDSISKLKETKLDNAIGQIISSSDKTSTQGYYDSNDKNVGRDISAGEDTDIEFEQDNDNNEDNNYDAVEASDEQEVYYEEIEQLETEKEVTEDSKTDALFEDYVVNGDESFDENVEEDNNYQNFNEDTAFVPKGTTSDSEENAEENIVTMSENVSEYPVVANDKRTSDENFTGNEDAEKNNNLTKNAEDTSIAGLYESAKNAETYETAMYYLDLAEKHIESNPTDYFPETFLRQKLYYKFHKNKVIAVGCIFVLAFFVWLYIYGETGRDQKMAELKAERERQTEYQRRREQEIIREREIQQKIRERQEKARIQAAKEAEERREIERTNNPEQTFLNFHKAITERRLRDAYNILSPDYQRFVGSYEKFAPGYNTTIKSEVIYSKILSNGDKKDSDIVTILYNLRAEDRDGSGINVRYFAGKAKLKKINGQWRIDSTEAKFTPVRDAASIIAKGEVNLRATPSTNASSVGVVREADEVQIIETATCDDSSAAIVISDEIFFKDGNRRIQLSKGMPVKIVRETGGKFVCKVFVNNQTYTLNFNSNHLVKLYGTTWYRVNSNNGTGWIYSKYAQREKKN